MSELPIDMLVEFRISVGRSGFVCRLLHRMLVGVESKRRSESAEDLVSESDFFDRL